MKRAFLTLTALVLGTVLSVNAATPRPAPDIRWGTAKGSTLRSFRGQPVVLLVSPSSSDKKVRAQVKRIWEYYRQLSERNLVVIGAFTRNPGLVKSNVPVAIAPDGAKIAQSLGVNPDEFTIVVIGKDGNMDLISDKVQAGQRLLDILINSYVPQSEQQRN